MQTINDITDAALNSIIEGIETPEGVILTGAVYVDGDQITALSDLDRHQREDVEELVVFTEVLYTEGCDADEAIVEQMAAAVEAALPAGHTSDSGPLGQSLRGSISDAPVTGFYAAWYYDL